MDRQQLDRRDTERLDVVDHFLGEAGVRAALMLGHMRMQLRESPNVGLIDDRAVPGGHADTGLALPVEVGVDDHALGHERRAVALIEAQIVVLGADGVAEDGVIPLQLADVAAGIRIEQQLVRVETMPGIGLVGTMHAQPVYRARVHIFDVAVPDLIGVFRQLQPFELLLALGVEQADFHLGGIGRKQGEIRSLAVPDRAMRVGASLPDSTH